MTVRSQNVRMDTEVGGSWEGKRLEGWEKGSLVPRPRPAFRRLKYGKVVEGLEYFIT